MLGTEALNFSSLLLNDMLEFLQPLGGDMILLN